MLDSSYELEFWLEVWERSFRVISDFTSIPLDKKTTIAHFPFRVEEVLEIWEPLNEKTLKWEMWENALNVISWIKDRMITLIDETNPIVREAIDENKWKVRFSLTWIRRKRTLN